jgi:FkbM family methyltransferase
MFVYRFAILGDMDKTHKTIDEFAKNQSDFTFVQIGAYDGITGDPIFDFVKKYHWKGVLVEPQAGAFATLTANYAGQKDIILENAAIAAEDGHAMLYGVRPTSDDNYNHGQLHSFNKETILKHAHMVKDLANRIEQYEVRTLTLESLLKKHNLSQLDLLQIDTEGYDYEIIKQINFDTTKPRLIHFEHKHLLPEDLQKCYRLLEQHGYSLEFGEYNTLAHTPSPKQ